MTKQFLIMTEGARTEQNILQAVLEKYGFNVIKQEPIRIHKEGDPFDFNLSHLTNDKINILIAQGPKNRISEFINMFDNQSEDVERYFKLWSENFAGIFLIYDVDHTSKEALENMFFKFQDETEAGLLLLSSPCIEILSEPNRTKELCVEHLKEYKTERKAWVQDKTSNSVENYIINNFEDLIIQFLKQNCRESGNNNVMEHPEYVLQQINLLNDRTYINDDFQPVLYRYFTTTLYVCIAYILGLTKEIDNSIIVENFFLSHKT